jgi:hypothetical protein
MIHINMKKIRLGSREGELAVIALLLFEAFIGTAGY